MAGTPFTITADREFGNALWPFLTDGNADVVIKEGSVPDHLSDAVERGVAFEISDGRFLLRVPNVASFLVENGNCITYNPAGGDTSEIRLFLLGSVWGVLCCQRGLVPLHASAIAIGEKVHAFTGRSGAGKSTLVSALADRGFEFFTDDVLVVSSEVADSEGTLCYPGAKSVKLWDDAFRLTRARKSAPVRSEGGFAKFYAELSSQSSRNSGRLTSLTLLLNRNARLDRDPIELGLVTGPAAILMLRESLYRPQFTEAIFGRRRLFEILTGLTPAIRFRTFDRPLDKKQFPESLDAITDWLIAQDQT